MPASAGRGRGRGDAPRASGFDSALAWAVVVAAHAALLWLASKAVMPPRPPAAGEPPTLVWLPPPADAPRAAAAPPARARSAARPRSTPPPRATASAEPDRGPTAADTGSVIELSVVPSEPPAAPPAPSRAPWDPPLPSARPFASRSPPLPGAGAQRFRMQPPRSIAATVEKVGRMFGGGGPGDCAETRANIRDLAVLGAEAVAQEVEEERRNCRK